MLKKRSVNGHSRKVDDMRVCLLNPFPVSFRFRGGVESMLYSLSLELMKRGVETEVISLSEEEMKIIPQFARLTISAVLMKKLLQSKDRFDVIHSHAWAVGTLWFIKNRPTVATAHGTTRGFLNRTWESRPIFSRTYNSLVTVNLERIGFACARQVTAVSESSKKEIVENYGIPEEKIAVVHNGIDVSTVRRVKTNLKDELGCEHLLLFMGRLAKEKGIGVLINAMPMLEDYDVKVVIAGEGPEEKDARRLVSELNLNERVIFTGTLDEKRKLEYLSASDVFVFPSFSESFGMALLDAMACKTPIVASNVASIPEVVGKCGILVEPRDPVELSKGIKKLLDDKKAAKRLANRAYERLVSNFTSGMMAEGYIRLYERVVG